MITMDSITATRHATPPRFLVHGQEKVGKSTFFAGAPKPIFIRTEDGLNGIDAQAFPLAESLQDVEHALGLLLTQEHDFKTVVIDSADWLEKLIFQRVCDDDNVDSIGFAAGGYGKGYDVALNHWRRVIRTLDYLNKQKGMIVGVICHSIVVPFNDPMHEPYDRIEMKLYQSKRGTGSRDLLMEWADIIGYAHKKIYVSKQETASGGKVARGVDAGAVHKLALKGTPAFVAGNRYSLPNELDLEWSAFQKAMSESIAMKQAA